MIRRRNIFLLALGWSLLLHLGSAEVYVGWWYIRHKSTGIAPRQKAAPEWVVSLDDMGDASGTGFGSNSSPGDTLLQAREANEDQALLSRDPQGSGPVAGPPSKYTGPTGDGAGGVPAVAVAAPLVPPTPTVEPMQPAPVTPPAPRQESDAQAAAKPESIPKLTEPPLRVASALPLPQTDITPIVPDVQMPKPTAPAPRPPTPAVKPQPAVVAVPQSTRGDGRTPGQPRVSAAPLPQSDSDSDPFSRLSSVTVFQNGKLDVRLGRKVKTTRPQVHIAGILDLIERSNPSVVVEVHIEPTGRVSDVKIARSSGSNQIDEPTRLAIYDWWFEPAKDKQGHAVKDVIFFTVEFI
jgi:TonB family protein